MPIEFNTPPGRIVWGHPSKSQDVIDPQTKQKRTDNDGNPRKRWTFGLAIPKDQCQGMFDAMQAATAEVFPGGAPDGFAWKFKDGDAKDKEGKPYADREGWAGCFVFSLATEFKMPPNYEFDYGTNKWADSDKIKRGDWVNVTVRVVAHKARNTMEKAGLYLNPDCICLFKTDKEITGGGVDPNARGFAPPPQQTPPANAPAPPGSSPPATATAPAAPPPSGSRPPGGAPHNPHTAFLRGPQPDAN